MFQALKVGFYRRFYRFSARRAWGPEAAPDNSGALELATSTWGDAFAWVPVAFGTIV